MFPTRERCLYNKCGLRRLKRLVIALDVSTLNQRVPDWSEYRRDAEHSRSTGYGNKKRAITALPTAPLLVTPSKRYRG